MDTTILRCPSCGANLKFNVQLQNWTCEQCGSVFSQNEVFKITDDSDENLDSQPELNVFRCESCGAEMVTDQNTTATFCVYCGNPGIIKSRLEGKYRPDYIIPFKKTKTDAEAAYQQLRQGRYLAPDEFGKKENIEKITGIYIPFWLYDGNSEISVKGTMVNSKTWRSGNYTYTQSDYYSVLREANMNFQRLPADGSKKFDDTMMDAIEPFDFNELQKFNYSFLSGFLAEKYDLDAEANSPRAEKRMSGYLMSKIKATIPYAFTKESENQNFKFSNVKYALFPVWMLNTKVKDKFYTFAMNGQTGKMVGLVPKDKRKIFMRFAIKTLIVFAIICVLSYYLFM